MACIELKLRKVPSQRPEAVGRNSKMMFSLRCAFRAVQTAFTGRDVARVHTRIEQQCFRTKFSRGGTCYFVGALT